MFFILLLTVVAGTCGGDNPKLLGNGKRIPGSLLYVEKGQTRATLDVEFVVGRLTRDGPASPHLISKKPEVDDADAALLRPRKPVDGRNYLID